MFSSWLDLRIPLPCYYDKRTFPPDIIAVHLLLVFPEHHLCLCAQIWCVGLLLFRTFGPWGSKYTWSLHVLRLIRLGHIQYNNTQNLGCYLFIWNTEINLFSKDALKDSKDIYNATKYLFQINAVLLNFLFIKHFWILSSTIVFNIDKNKRFLRFT